MPIFSKNLQVLDWSSILKDFAFDSDDLDQWTSC